jgi:hypothetical protein
MQHGTFSAGIQQLVWIPAVDGGVKRGTFFVKKTRNGLLDFIRLKCYPLCNIETTCFNRIGNLTMPPVTISTSVSKKIGLPNYSSLGASCGLQFEIDSRILLVDPELLRRQIRDAYAACDESVQNELARQRAMPFGSNQKPDSRAHRNGAGTHGCNGSRATSRQMAFVEELAGEIRELNAAQLETLALRVFGKPLTEFTTHDASQLIDTLKAIKAGKLELHSVLNDAQA